MAHMAELNNDNTVSRVIAINNSELLDDNGIEQESVGIAFCKSIYGPDTRWAQTSYNGSFRNVFAGIGAFFDETNDRFINPKPYPSWILNEESGEWDSPVPMPSPQEYTLHVWNEDAQQWDAVVDPRISN